MIWLLPAVYYGDQHLSRVPKAFSAAIGQGLVSLATDPLSTWLYTSIACISFVTVVLFWICFRKLDKEKDALNALPDSTYRGRKNSVVDVVGIREEQAKQQRIRVAQGLAQINPQVTVAGEKV